MSMTIHFNKSQRSHMRPEGAFLYISTKIQFKHSYVNIKREFYANISSFWNGLFVQDVTR